jgi:nuclease S1
MPGRSHPASCAETTQGFPCESLRVWTGLAFVALAVATVAPTAAFGWGRLGHRASARLTERLLSPAARAGVAAILEPGETLISASTWADEVRRDFPESGPWHYVNVPIGAPNYSDKFCGTKGCVIAKVNDFRKTVADRNAPLGERRKALRFLVHFVQDMHQPVHVGDRGDRGGNDLQVQFFGAGSNLHRVWDSGLIEHDSNGEEKLAGALGALAGSPGSASWAEGTVTDWADESLAAARSAYNDPSTGRELRKGAKLGEAYQEANVNVARTRLAQSGVRLARILNEAFEGR